MCRVPIIFRFTVVVELRALATRCPCRSRVHHRRGAASTCVAKAPIWVSHAKAHRLQHCRAPVQALVSQRVQRTRTSELMGRLAEAFCEHLMHGAAAARMSACMAKPAITSCQAAFVQTGWAAIVQTGGADRDTEVSSGRFLQGSIPAKSGARFRSGDLAPTRFFAGIDPCKKRCSLLERRSWIPAKSGARFRSLSWRLLLLLLLAVHL